MKRLISIVLSVLLLLSCCVMAMPTVSAAPAQLDAPGTFSLIDENANLALYIDYSTGIFGVLNKKTNTVWYSNPADRANEMLATDDNKAELNNLLTVTYLTSEFKSLSASSLSASFVTEHNKEDIILSFYFDTVGMEFIIPVKLSLEDDYLRVELMIDKIKEFGSSKILNINLFPLFGAAGLNDTGYALMADGNGSLIEFNADVRSLYEFGLENEGVFYGENPTEVSGQSYFNNYNEPFRLPVYGIVKNGEAFLNIIESGAAVSETHAYISRYINSYNTIYTSIGIRDTQTRTTAAGKSGSGFYYTDELSENYVARYYFMEGNDADYVGMAKKYRDYLINEKGMTPVNENVSNALCVSLYGAVKKAKHFLGIPYTGVEPLTTFAEAEELIDRLNADQIDKVYMNYLGWGTGGLETTLKTSFSTEKALGTKKTVNSLISKVNSIDNYFLSFDLDLQAFYKKNSDVDKFENTAYGLNSSPVTVFRKRISIGSLDKGSIAHQLIHPADMLGYAQEFMANAGKREVNSFSFNSIGSSLYCAYNRNEIVTRDESAKIMSEVFTAASEALGDKGIINTTGGNAYAAPYVDNILEAPVYGSHNNIALQEVPFYQIVFRGYVNLASEPMNLNSERNNLILRLAETGMSMYYLLMDEDSTALQDTSFASSYACELDDHYDDMVAIYKRLKTVYDAVGTSSIDDFEIISDDVRVTTYSNGVKVYVNYGNEAVTVNGVLINAEDFTVVGGANS